MSAYRVCALSMEVEGVLEKRVDEDTPILSFNTAVYGLDAVKKAACRFGSHFYIFIEQRDHMIEVRLIPKRCCHSAGAFMREFCNEVLDQELRRRVTAEMAEIRNLLSARVFSKPFHAGGKPSMRIQSAPN